MLTNILSLALSSFFAAMKSDRKRLKAEKADLVNQMQQLYATLESREEQLRDFIRNYEQHRKVRRPCREHEQAHTQKCAHGEIREKEEESALLLLCWSDARSVCPGNNATKQWVISL